MAMIDLFGTALDPDEGAERIALKRRAAQAPRLPGACDPYDVLAPRLRCAHGVRDRGKVTTPSWLTPMPEQSDLEQLTAANFGRFVRAGGCRDYAHAVGAFVREHASGAPLMIGVDHSASGGVIEALADRYGPANLYLIVIDSHLDAVPERLRQGLLDFARERPDFAARVRPDEYVVASAKSPESTYDCGSFLRDLLERDVIPGGNIAVLGPADLPHERLFASNDPRVQRFIAGYRGAVERGMVFLPREIIEAVDDVRALVHRALSEVCDKAIYVSIDMDAGARNALAGVRYLEPGGLDAPALLALIEAVFDVATQRGNRLVGCDLMEFDFYRAGTAADDRLDPTYDLAHRFAAGAIECMQRNR